eukprot:m.195507 g.195507  ORF g.195507 m.195507 type:complete len:337 (+) comp18312_c1_seq1:123-1133(+)
MPGGLDAPIITPTSDAIDTETPVEMRCAKHCTIFYTVNGRKPNPYQKFGTPYTLKYTGPITLNEGRVAVKAVSVSRKNQLGAPSSMVTKFFEVTVPGVLPIATSSAREPRTARAGVASQRRRSKAARGLGEGDSSDDSDEARPAWAVDQSAHSANHNTLQLTASLAESLVQQVSERVGAPSHHHGQGFQHRSDGMLPSNQPQYHMHQPLSQSMNAGHGGLRHHHSATRQQQQQHGADHHHSVPPSEFPRCGLCNAARPKDPTIQFCVICGFHVSKREPEGGRGSWAYHNPSCLPNDLDHLMRAYHSFVWLSFLATAAAVGARAKLSCVHYVGPKRR